MWVDGRGGWEKRALGRGWALRCRAWRGMDGGMDGGKGGGVPLCCPRPRYNSDGDNQAKGAVLGSVPRSGNGKSSYPRLAFRPARRRRCLPASASASASAACVRAAGFLLPTAAISQRKLATPPACSPGQPSGSLRQQQPRPQQGTRRIPRTESRATAAQQLQPWNPLAVPSPFHPACRRRQQPPIPNPQPVIPLIHPSIHPSIPHFHPRAPSTLGVSPPNPGFKLTSSTPSTGSRAGTSLSPTLHSDFVSAPGVGQGSRAGGDGWDRDAALGSNSHCAFSRSLYLSVSHIPLQPPRTQE